MGKKISKLTVVLLFIVFLFSTEVFAAETVFEQLQQALADLTNKSEQSEENAVDNDILPFSAPLASEPINAKYGEVIKKDDVYVYLDYVKIMNYIPTSWDDEDLPEGDELIVAFYEIYNPSTRNKTIKESDFLIYTDSVACSTPDTLWVVEVDGFSDMGSYDSFTLRPGTKATLCVARESKQGWKEANIFYTSKASWKILNEEVGYDPYTYRTTFSENESKPVTNPGDVIYEGSDQTIIYDGYTTYTDYNMFTGYHTYAVMFFTITNNKTRELNYSFSMYDTTLYHNNSYVGKIDYTFDLPAEYGYTDIFYIDPIMPGMSAKVYCAFEMPEIDLTGSYNMFFVKGNKTLGEVYTGKVYTDSETVAAVQAALNELGYNCGTPDGSAGPMTSAAITQYKTDNGMSGDSVITQEVYDALLGKE